MEEIANRINKMIAENYQLTEREEKLAQYALSFSLNFPRIEKMIERSIDIKLDKTTIVCFLVYQLIKMNPEQEEKVVAKLNKEEQVLVTDFKSIKNINELTTSEEVEDIKKLFLVMGKDLRVVILKLFGVYYDVSILNNPLTEEEKGFVKQVKEIHMPLSERLGLDNLKQAMNDNVVRLEHPEEFERLTLAIESKREENIKQLEITKAKIENVLKELNIKGEIQSRIKRVSSIFNKLHNKQLSLDQIYDILAMRVIVQTVEECYEVLGRIHGLYKPMVGRMKDYIANPKPNGYQSLHTAIIVDNQHPMEVQIRTVEMHKESEYGVYSHWLYKEKKTKQDALDKRMTWFRETIDNAKTMSNEDFIESLKSDLYEGLLVVQTPKGRVLEFPEGSTVIDFAYAIHSDIGNQCVGAKINGKLRPFNTTLKNGDIVEILTNANSKGPSRDWLKVVKTASARSKIKAFFKNELKEENVKLGKTMLYQAMQEKGYTSAQLLTEEYLAEILKKYNMETLDELYAAIGSGSVATSQALSRFINLSSKEEKEIPKISSAVHLKRNNDGVLIDGDSGMMVRFAGCCSPIEGDDIIGYISRGRGVTIHRLNCPNLHYLEEERLVEATWHNKDNTTFTAIIRVVAEKSDNNIGRITNQITALKIAIKGFDAKDVGNSFFCTLVIDVKNKKELESAINSIRGIKGILSVERGER
ncbi:MAG: bifunctional (p)ppGpp synthetase/guanosine-3',5'-bis(diphosphate) 3'-pyrophosphohydrolase [Clostridia bacterium]|nr:bifunctional (p)ppGpp synthetase/guanosine-3',5'-bis(diphosphate) 3'-pyrophosphohydrolase [Clostridia bacterium]